VHAYIVDGFNLVEPLLLNLERLLGENIINNLTTLIPRSLMEYGGLIVEHVVSKLTCFASNGIAMCIGIQISVVTQLKYKATSFIIGMHYMAHCTNLTM
jgi:hypothetical protein